jgi:hypothetical protein
MLRRLQLAAGARGGLLLHAAGRLQPPRAARGLFVAMESTPNPDSLKFLPEDRVVLPEALGSGLHFSSAAEARGSKLVRALLKHSEITGVFLGRDFLSVNKRESAAWQPLKVIVVDAIMDAYAEQEAKGTPIVETPAASEDTAALPEDSEVVAMIKELIETRIRPAVQEDGGDIFFVCVLAAGSGRAGPCRSLSLISDLLPSPSPSSPRFVLQRAARLTRPLAWSRCAWRARAWGAPPALPRSKMAWRTCSCTTFPR